MTWLRYLRYRCKAKGRHGTHSPFAYGFVEQVLRPPGDEDPVRLILRYLHQQGIINQSQHWEDSDSAVSHGLSSHKLLIAGPQIELSRLQELSWPKGSSLLIMCPHSNAHRHACWEALRQRAAIQLSIDAWSFGLLLGNDRFKQKQHFYLR